MQASELNYSTVLYLYRKLREILDVFGLFPEKSGGKYEDSFVEQIVQAVIDIRTDLRKEKQWQLSDKIRDVLKENGIELKDVKEGTRWRKVD